MKPIQKSKSFFKNKNFSESALELLKMFIIPFLKGWDPNASVDDAIAAFFATDYRKIFHGKAKRNFEIPGQHMQAGNKLVKRFKNREVKKDQYLLVAIDRKDQTAKVDVEIMGRWETFVLARPEMEFLKDYIEVKEV